MLHKAEEGCFYVKNVITSYSIENVPNILIY